ncbi:MAG: SpoIIE family protein phosphatase, partial [Chlorobi bacterium]|nr:SpoIIE family protein phosphatase [Chlorobiota bacterium]
ILMKKEKEAVDAIILRQRIIGAVIFLLIIILIFFLNSQIKSRRKSKEANLILSKQNKKIEEDAKKISIANKRIAYKNAYITDNIKYARKIQTAMLPSKKEIDKIIPQNFIIYKPKNIVSGDFYSVKEIDNKIIIIIGDCTGHGVSGAFMSILGMSLINDILLKDEILEPALFLDTLREGIISSLHQKKEYTEATDGMDLAICIYDKDLKQIKYAGAQMSLYIASSKGVKRIKPDIMPVGVGFRDNRNFSQQTINITGKETIYLFSDGYPDQFGGKKAKKFMLGNVIKILESIYDKPMNIQKNFLEASLKQWQGTHKQVDDILFAGFRF